MSDQAISLRVNGHLYEVLTHPLRSLLSVLRNDLGLTGTKEYCLQAECGVCTVLVDGKAVNSCLYPVIRAVGKEVVTIEGLSTTLDLHPMQQAFVDHAAVQCGYCIPGMIMSAVSLLNEIAEPSEEEIEEALAGNLCRCTGYVKIIDAVRAVSDGM